MPSYDYLCQANGRIVEVSHRISESLATWGEVCERAGIDVGVTSPEAPVERLITGGAVVSSGSLGSGRDSSPPSCGGGSCCGGGFR